MADLNSLFTKNISPAAVGHVVKYLEAVGISKKSTENARFLLESYFTKKETDRAKGLVRIT